MFKKVVCAMLLSCMLTSVVVCAEEAQLPVVAADEDDRFSVKNVEGEFLPDGGVKLSWATSEASDKITVEYSLDETFSDLKEGSVNDAGECLIFPWEGDVSGTKVWVVLYAWHGEERIGTSGVCLVTPEGTEVVGEIIDGVLQNFQKIDNMTTEAVTGSGIVMEHQDPSADDMVAIG